MKKIKILSLAMAVLLLVTVFASCGKYNKPSKLFENDYVDQTVTFTTAEQLNISGTVVADNGDLVQLTDQNDQGNTVLRIYNLKTNHVVYEVANSLTLRYNASLQTQMETSYFVVTCVDSASLDNVKTTRMLYDAKGTLLTSSDQIGADDVYDMVDLICFGDTVFRIGTDGSITKVMDRKGLDGSLPRFDQYTENYYFAIDGEECFIYDKALNSVGYYQTPSYAEGNIAVLANGNLFVQYTSVLPVAEEEYDVYMDGSKWKLTTLVYDVEDKTEKEVDLAYIVMGLSAATYSGNSVLNDLAAQDITDDVENLAYAISIENKRFNWSADKVEMLILDNDGTIDKKLEQTVDFQDVAELPERVGEDRYLLETLFEQTLLVNGDGDVIGDVTGMQHINELYILTDEAIYDMDLNSVFNLLEKKMTVKHVLERAVLLEDAEEKVYLFTGTGEPTLLTPDDNTGVVSSVGDRIFAVCKLDAQRNATYTYYNDLGTAILSDVKVLLTFVAYSEDETIAMYSGLGENNKVVYYAFK